MPRDPVRASDHELRRAPAHVDDQRPGRKLTPGRHAAVGQEGLVVAREEARVEAVAPFDLAEKSLAVLGIADGARGHCQRAVGPARVERPPVVGEDVTDPGDRGGEEEPPHVHLLAEPRDGQAAVELAHDAVLDVCDEQARRVRPQVDDADARHLRR